MVKFLPKEGRNRYKPELQKARSEYAKSAERFTTLLKEVNLELWRSEVMNYLANNAHVVQLDVLSLRENWLDQLNRIEEFRFELEEAFEVCIDFDDSVKSFSGNCNCLWPSVAAAQRQKMTYVGSAWGARFHLRDSDEPFANKYLDIMKRRIVLNLNREERRSAQILREEAERKRKEGGLRSKKKDVQGQCENNGNQRASENKDLQGQQAGNPQLPASPVSSEESHDSNSCKSVNSRPLFLN